VINQLLYVFNHAKRSHVRTVSILYVSVVLVRALNFNTAKRQSLIILDIDNVTINKDRRLLSTIVQIKLFTIKKIHTTKYIHKHMYI